MEPHLLPPGGDLALPARLRGALRHHAAHPLRPRGARGRVGRRGAGAGGSTRARASSRPRSWSAASGRSTEPQLPHIPGHRELRGPVFHSARWDHDVDLNGQARRVDRHRRVGDPVRAPRSSREVEQLHVFQRTPPWVMPHSDRPVTELERRVYRRLPALQRLVRAAVYWGREWLVLGFTRDKRLMKAIERIARRHLQEAGPRPRAARQADARLHARLQAHPADQRLVSGDHQAQRRGGHRRDPRRSSRARS